MGQDQGEAPSLSFLLFRRHVDPSTQRKCFWLLFAILSIGAYFLPLWWGIAETLASLVASWWIIYRSEIF
jgi:hypothetical protein